jgi:hypothetical protein
VTKQIGTATTVLAVAMFVSPVPAAGQASSEPAHDVTDLAKKTQNPVGDLITVALLSQFWPLHDDGGDPETDLFVLQPFVNYNFGKGYALSFAPIISANWDAVDGQQWTVPLGVGITRTTVFNRRPMNIGVQYYYNVERPDGSAAHQLRFVVAALYPTGPK